MRILDKENCDFQWPAVVAVRDGGWVADSRGGGGFNWSVLGDVKNEMTTNKCKTFSTKSVFILVVN